MNEGEQKASTSTNEAAVVRCGCNLLQMLKIANNDKTEMIEDSENADFSCWRPK